MYSFFLFSFLPYFSFQDAIVIHEVYEEGAAARDGRLWAGDQILEVCLCVCMRERVERLESVPGRLCNVTDSWSAWSKMEICCWFEALYYCELSEQCFSVFNFDNSAIFWT